MLYEIFTDGSSSRNRQSIGFSYIIYKNKKFFKQFKYGFKDKEARNGLAELLGVYFFLFHTFMDDVIFFKKDDKIIVYSDSQYVVNELTIWYRDQMIKNFYNTKNKEVIIYILYLLQILREDLNLSVKFEWVKGHQKGNSFKIKGNNLADKKAVESHKNIPCKDIEFLISKLKDIIKNEEILKCIKEYYLKNERTNK